MVCFIYWRKMVMRKLYRLMLVLCLFHTGTCFGAPLTIFNLNAANYDDHPNWAERAQKIALDIKESGAQIIALQEIRYNEKSPYSKDGKNMAEHILEHLQDQEDPAYDSAFENAGLIVDIGMRYNKPGDPEHWEGLAIIYQTNEHLALVEHGSKGISGDILDSPYDSGGDLNKRIIQYAQFNFHEDPFIVYNTHFSYDTNCQIINAFQAVDYFSTIQSEMSPQLPAFFMGDFNATPSGKLSNEAMFDIMRDDPINQWKDCWLLLHPDTRKNRNKSYTFPSKKPVYRIDYIWINAPLQTTRGTHVESVSKVAKTPDDNGIYPSDHIGLLLTIDLK